MREKERKVKGPHIPICVPIVGWPEMGGSKKEVRSLRVRHYHCFASIFLKQFLHYFSAA